MWQKYKIYLITGLAACWSVLNSACNETYDHKGKTPIVEVDGNFLYKQDLLSAMPPGATGKDSIKFAEEYIRNWVNDVLLFKKAEGNIPDNVKIDELVNSYRRALIMHTYLEELVNQEVGDNVTSSEIEEFYNQNSGAFLAEEPYIRGLYIKVPVNASDISSVRRWYKDTAPSPPNFCYTRSNCCLQLPERNIPDLDPSTQPLLLHHTTQQVASRHQYCPPTARSLRCQDGGTAIRRGKAIQWHENLLLETMAGSVQVWQAPGKSPACAELKTNLFLL